MRLFNHLEVWRFLSSMKSSAGRARWLRSGRRRICTLTLCALFLTSALWSTALMGPAAYAQSCPADASAWQRWRDEMIDEAFDQVRTTANRSFIDFQEFVTVAGEIRAFGVRCLGSSENRITVPADLGPVIGNFFALFGTIGVETDPDHAFGMTVSDQDYVNAVRDVIELPSLLTSQEFLNAVSDRKSYRQAQELIESHNATLPEEQRWILLLYKSRFLTTPDRSRTYGRFFVLVPGEATDKWIQFGILTPEMGDALVNNLSIVAVRRLPGHARETPRTETFMVDYWRTYPDGDDQDAEIDVRTKFEAGQGTENCSDCHKTPVIGIHPAVVYRFDNAGKLTPVTGAEAQAIPNLINSFIEEYGPPHYRGWQPQADLGPALGPVGATRPDELFDTCTSGTGLTPASYDTLREAMNCAGCHDDDLLGRINFPQAVPTTREFALAHPDTNAFSPLVETYVREGWMPPGISLAANERRALVGCLHHEYLDLNSKAGLLIDWLKGGG